MSQPSGSRSHWIERLIRVAIAVVGCAGVGAWATSGGGGFLTSWASLGQATKDASETMGILPVQVADGQPTGEGLVTVEALTVSAEPQAVLPRNYTGVLRATRTSNLGFKTTGSIQRVLVDAGDRVKQGQVLAVLDSRQLSARYRVLESQRDAAQALLAELKAGPRSQTIAAAQADVESAQAMVARANATFERMSRLLSSDSVARQDYDDAKHNLDAVKKQQEAKQAALEELEEGTRPEKIEAQQAIVKQLEAELSAVQVQLDDTQLKAPFDAVVAQRMLDEGVVVAPGSQVLKLVEDKLPEAWVGVPVDKARALQVGEVIHATVEGQGYPLKLKTILPELDPATRTQMAVLQFQEATNDTGSKPRFAVGQLVQLQLSQPTTNSGFWLPLTALTRDANGLWSAMVLEPVNDPSSDQVFFVRRTDLEVVHVDSARVLVRGLLQEGDQVVAAGVQKLSPGQRVKLAKPSAKQSHHEVAEETSSQQDSRT